MGRRLRIAAASCLVASGLLVGGASNTLAYAAPAPDSVGADGDNDSKTDPGQNDGTTSRPQEGAGNETSTDAETRGDKPDDRNPNGRKPGERQPGGEPLRDQKPQKPDDEKPVGGDSDDGEEGKGEEGEEGVGEGEPPAEEEPEDCWPWWPPGGPDPEPGSPPQGGGGGAGIPGRPSGRPEVPSMQLPTHLLPEHTPSQPGVIDTEPGVGITVSDTPLAPIALPVIVAPPLALPGGAAPRGLPSEPVPSSPRGAAAETPAGRQAPPAEVGRNVGTPPASYRVGYAESLRSAGISQVVALAAPGLAGMLILTGLGGLVGYRQAKAGHAIRTGGAARFVN